MQGLHLRFYPTLQTLDCRHTVAAHGAKVRPLTTRKLSMTKPAQHYLGGLNITILVTNGFEQVKLTGPRDALEESGVIIRMLSDKPGQVQGQQLQTRRYTGIQ
jgi:putative intracellular protease/amidase